MREKQQSGNNWLPRGQRAQPREGWRAQRGRKRAAVGVGATEAAHSLEEDGP